MPSSAKKYKLLSAPEGSGAKECAFFLSADGCRNGANCKFLHSNKDQSELKPKEISDTASVVSSESEASAAAPAKKENDVNMFVENPPKDSETKKNNKKRRKSEDNDIFAAPKATAKSPAPKATAKSPAAVKAPPTPTAAAEPKTEEPKKKKQKSEKPSSNEPETTDFRSLISTMPVASFFIPGSSPEPRMQPAPAAAKKEQPPLAKSTRENPAGPPNTKAGNHWKKAVTKTQTHDRYATSLDFDKYKELERNNKCSGEWITAKPYGAWCKNNPVAIAIDCEMCETQDPETKSKNHKALCRISVVNADKPDEVLLDTLVKPEWPVSDYRTRINGISEENLENVQFTLQHAQAFMEALCSENTVIVGQAVHNDLAAMRMEHYCIADSAHLFEAKDALGASVSLKDLVKAIFKKDMPNTHDSVNDARKALECVEHWIEKDGKVDAIERTSKNYGHQLFIHRIPKHCKPEHLSLMFLKHASVEPSDVEPIEFANGLGKTHVVFRSSKHASLAFDTLDSKIEEEKSGRLQKKVYLRNGDYIRVRKMAFPKRKFDTPNKATPSKATPSKATPSKN
jgi:RNA exonuclease 1